jgi:hypothetical protein
MASEMEVEAHEVRERLEELREEEKEARSLTQGWIRWVALTTALMAVLAAIAALQASAYANEALLASNESILAQTKASDTWTEYQANGLKVILRQFQASTINDVNQTEDLRNEANRQLDRQKAEMERALELEKERDQFRARSDAANAIHEHFAQSVAALQVGIGLASVAALTRRKEIWALGGLFGGAGAGLLGWGFTGAV